MAVHMTCLSRISCSQSWQDEVRPSSFRQSGLDTGNLRAPRQSHECNMFVGACSSEKLSKQCQPQLYFAATLVDRTMRRDSKNADLVMAVPSILCVSPLLDSTTIIIECFRP